MFFVFEGLDGCGKSTLIHNYKLHLESIGHKVYVTREPGGTPLGEELRHTLLSIKKNTDFKISSRAELLLYEASRAQHVDQVIRPKVKSGIVVLCDRFTASSVAFQAGGRTLNLKDVEWLNDFATESFKPSKHIFIDLDYVEAQKRKSKMGLELDRLESEASNFHHQVYNSYKKQVEANPQDWIVLDGKLNPEQILDSLILKLKLDTELNLKSDFKSS